MRPNSLEHAMTATRTPSLEPAQEASLNAYNSTFAAMDIDWHWDSSTYQELVAEGGQPVRVFVERHRPHLLRAYGIDCLVNAIESTRAGLRGQAAR
jgi:hypothetical protein